MKNYGLDPAWYYTSPGLSWDALLKVTGVKLVLLTDPDKLLFFEQGTRGGISTITLPFGKSNNLERNMILKNLQLLSRILMRITYTVGR